MKTLNIFTEAKQTLAKRFETIIKGKKGTKGDTQSKGFKTFLKELDEQIYDKLSPVQIKARKKAEKEHKQRMKALTKARLVKKLNSVQKEYKEQLTTVKELMVQKQKFMNRINKITDEQITLAEKLTNTTNELYNQNRNAEYLKEQVKKAEKDLIDFENLK